MSSADHTPTDDVDTRGSRDVNPEADSDAVCPFCGSSETALESTFGSEVSKSQYYCAGCHTVFERIKYDGATPSTGRDNDSN